MGLALAGGNAAAGSYSFTNVADNSGPFSTISRPSLNDSGTLAFRAFDADLNGGEGIYTGSGGPITTIATTSGPFLTFSFSDQSLNDNGTVAFDADLNGGAGIFTGSGGPSRPSTTPGGDSAPLAAPLSTTAALWRSSPAWARVGRHLHRSRSVGE